jgi:HlyD family secretion protein
LSTSTSASRKRRLVALGVLLLIGGAIVFSGWRADRVELPVDTMALYGAVDIREIQLAFHEIEHVESVLVEEGDRVRAGQLLATQDANLLEAQVAAASADVEAAATLRDAEANARRPGSFAGGWCNTMLASAGTNDPSRDTVRRET